MGATMAQSKRASDIRRVVYELLEQGPIGERRTRFASRIIILLIVVNLVTAALETVPALELAYGNEFAVIEWLSLAIFSVEYLARLWCAAAIARRRLSPRR